MPSSRSSADATVVEMRGAEQRCKALLGLLLILASPELGEAGVLALGAGPAALASPQLAADGAWKERMLDMMAIKEPKASTAPVEVPIPQAANASAGSASPDADANDFQAEAHEIPNSALVTPAPTGLEPLRPSATSEAKLGSPATTVPRTVRRGWSAHDDYWGSLGHGSTVAASDASLADAAQADTPNDDRVNLASPATATPAGAETHKSVVPKASDQKTALAGDTPARASLPPRSADETPSSADALRETVANDSEILSKTAQDILGEIARRVATDSSFGKPSGSTAQDILRDVAAKSEVDRSQSGEAPWELEERRPEQSRRTFRASGWNRGGPVASSEPRAEIAADIAMTPRGSWALRGKPGADPRRASTSLKTFEGKAWEASVDSWESAAIAWETATQRN